MRLAVDGWLQTISVNGLGSPSKFILSDRLKRNPTVMVRPIGCGDVTSYIPPMEFMLLRGVKPPWDLKMDKRGRPALHASVWLRTGCCSHFWLRTEKLSGGD